MLPLSMLSRIAEHYEGSVVPALVVHIVARGFKPIYVVFNRHEEDAIVRVIDRLCLSSESTGPSCSVSVIVRPCVVIFAMWVHHLDKSVSVREFNCS